MNYRITILLFIFIVTCLPVQASAPNPTKPSLPARYQNHWFTKLVVKKVQKRQARLERKLAEAKTPKEIARIKKKQEITSFKVVLFFVSILAGLVGLVGLLFKADNFANICFVIMVIGLAILFPSLFR